MKTRALPILAMTFAALLGCNNNNPSYTGRPDVAVSPPEKPAPQSFAKRFEFSTSEQTVTQDKFDKNTVSVLFQVTGANGLSVNNLKASDLRVEENGVNVTPIKLSADEERSSHVVDIVFVVDTTKSMIPFIATATRRISDFVRTSRAAGYHTRMCFSTFGDTVGKKCDRFYDNNPTDASTESQVRELLSDLGGVKALPKNDDPANTDIPENPMRALIEATKAPWAADSQRFVILVTDAGFLSAPDNLGAMFRAGKMPAEAMPPTMEETVKAIRDSQISVYAVAPKLPGYTGSFQGQDGIVEASKNGRFYAFRDVLADSRSLESILKDIIETVNTTYKIEYVVDDVTGLDPTLKEGDRHLTIVASGGTTSINSVLSSMPTGRAQYKSAWDLGEPVQSDSLKVFVDGKELSASEFTLAGTTVTLNSVPKPEAKLRFVYFYQDIAKNLRVEQIVVNGEGDPRDIRVTLNEKVARATDYTVEKDLQGNAIIHLNEASVLATSDPYGIRQGRGVDVQVITNFNR